MVKRVREDIVGKSEILPLLDIVEFILGLSASMPDGSDLDKLAAGASGGDIVIYHYQGRYSWFWGCGVLVAVILLP